VGVPQRASRNGTLGGGGQQRFSLPPPGVGRQVGVGVGAGGDGGPPLRFGWARQFGTAALLRRFPGATVYATEGVIAQMRRASPDGRPSPLFAALFPGQIPETPVVAQPVPEGGILVDGEVLQAIEVGHSDTDDSTVLHVPSIGLIVAGDVIYNNVHQFLAESAGGGLEAWLRAVDKVEALRPRHVVAGHKTPGGRTTR
jgi:glyoxylase-like metal-dependent hydrolase (beta-lactamase superfamily II)